MPDILLKKSEIKAKLLAQSESLNDSDLYTLIEQFMAGYAAPAHPGKSLRVFRLRNNRGADVDSTGNFATVERFWVSPSAPLNRVNVEGQSVLYCSSQEAVCIKEAKILPGDIVTICEWKVDPETSIATKNMGFRKDSVFVDAAGNRIIWGRYRQAKLNLRNDDLDAIEFVDDFLFDVFTEPSDKYYRISGSVGKLYLNNAKGGSLDAISYPSVKFDGRGPGVNWAYSPNFAERNLIPVCFRKYLIQANGNPQLLSTVQYQKAALDLNAQIIWS